MNTLTRLVAGLATAALTIVFLFFLTTLGIFIAAIVGIALFVGALALRGKTSETKVGSFRVITFGSQPFGSQPFGSKQFGSQQFGSQESGSKSFEVRQSGESAGGQQKALDDVVDLSPEDYKPVEPSDDKKKPE